MRFFNPKDYMPSSSMHHLNSKSQEKSQEGENRENEKKIKGNGRGFQYSRELKVRL